MRRFMENTPAESLAGWYGYRGNLYGVLTDHEHLLPGGSTRVLASGSRVAVGSDGRAIDIRCGWIIEVSTEDGPSDGRCGLRVVGDDFACEGHMEERRSYGVYGGV